MSKAGKTFLVGSLALLFAALSLLINSTSTVASQPLSLASTGTTVPTDANLLPTFNQLLKTCDKCTLPCWWGFIPGKSKYTDFLNFLHKNALDRNMELSADGSGYLYLIFLSSTQLENGSNFLMFFGQEKGILSSLDIRIDKPGQWLDPDIQLVTFPGIFKHTYGVPRITVGPDSSIARFLIGLYYPDVKVEYVLDLSAYQKDFSWAPLKICPDLSAIRTVSLHLGQDDDTEQEDATPDQIPPVERGNLSEMFDTTETDFVNFFVQHPTGCLETTLRGLPSTSTP